MDPDPAGALVTVALYFLVPTIISFFCSLLEAVLLSTSPAHIAIGVKKGQRSAKLLQSLKTKIDRPLAAILTLNTIAQTAGAAGMGAHVLSVFGSEWLAVASALMTFLILVFAELIPKKIAVQHWRRLAAPSAYAFVAMITLTYPLVLVSEWISNYVTDLLKSKHKVGGVTREEVIETAEMGVSEGALKRKESFIIKNILSLENARVTDIMTPRNEVFGAEANQTVGQLMKHERQLRYSRLPIYDRNLDQIVGVVHRYLILEAYSRDRDLTPLRSLMKPISRVSHRLSVSQILEEFIQRREHIFIVINDTGKTLGLVTFDDAIETLLGAEIGDPFESVEQIRKATFEQWRRYRVRPIETIGSNANL